MTMSIDMSNGTTVWVSGDIIELVDKVSTARHDATRSDTLRFLIMRALAEMNFLPAKSKKALGVKLTH